MPSTRVRSSTAVVMDGECVEIATGAPVPKGADAVVMVEYTRLISGGVEIQREAKPGSNVAPEGEDIKRGEAVVKAGEVMTPGKIGAVAALGFQRVKVYARAPRRHLLHRQRGHPSGEAVEAGAGL